MPNPVTMHDIAKDLGLSYSTCHQAYHRTGVYANQGEATIRRVQSYAKLVGYNPKSASTAVYESRVCKGCGMSFTASHRAQKYCSTDCKMKMKERAK